MFITFQGSTQIVKKLTRSTVTEILKARKNGRFGRL